MSNSKVLDSGGGHLPSCEDHERGEPHSARTVLRHSITFSAQRWRTALVGLKSDLIKSGNISLFVKELTR